MARRSVLALCVLFLSCRTTESAVRPEGDVSVDAGVEQVAVPVAKVELAPAPALPPRPAGLPAVPDDAQNPLTAEKADLGWKLFFDARLSKDESKSCASCHLPERAYTTPNALDMKVGGAMNKRNAPTMVNLGYHAAFYWDGRAPNLDAVSLAAWKGQLGAEPEAVVKKLSANPTYAALFQRAFASGPTASNVPQALASFFRALWSGNSAWDFKKLSADAKKGEAVFTKAKCVACHAPPLFTDLAFQASPIGAGKPENERDFGRKEATKADDDAGKFKTPSLRNVALTSPYFHDGSVATLDGAIEQMLVVAKSPKLSAKEKASLKAFLEALSGEVAYPKAPELP